MAKKAIDRFTIRYTSFKWYVTMTHRLFYRKMQVKFLRNIPRDRPVLLAPNHQNALMDAMGPLLTSRRDPVFLTRADVFNNRFLAGVFRIFKMLPVYRMRDGAAELAKNEAIFQESIGALERKRSPVCIMPEGNHGDKRRLRTLVKGIFRVAFQAQESYEESPGVVIVPVGIDYSNYSAFRGHMFIQYGKPIEVCEYYAEYRETQPRAMNSLRERLSAELCKYIIDIRSEEYYDIYMLMRNCYNKRMRERMGMQKKDLYHRLLADQHMIRELSCVEKEHPEDIESLAEMGREYAEGVQELRMRDWVFSRKRYPIPLLMLAGVGMILLLPVFLYGALTNYILYRLIEKFTASRIKDPQFHSSIKFVMGTFLFPVYYLILFIPVWIFTDPGWIKWAFLGSLPVCGLIAHTWLIWFKKLGSLWRYQFMTLGGNEKLEKLKTLRVRIIERMDSMVPVRPPEQA